MLDLDLNHIGQAFWVWLGLLNHLLSLGGKVRFDGGQDFDGSCIVYEINSGSLLTETSGTTDSVKVSFKVWFVITGNGNVVVDDQTNIVDVDSTCQYIGCNEDVRLSISEGKHSGITIIRFDASVENRASVSSVCQSFVDQVSISLGSDKDNTLTNGQERINVRQELQFSTLVFSSVDPELFDNVQNLLHAGYKKKNG